MTTELRKPIEVHGISIKRRVDSLQTALSILIRVDDTGKESDFKIVMIPLPVPSNIKDFSIAENLLNKFINEVNKL